MFLEPLVLCRQAHGKGGALTDLGGDVELAAMAVEDVLDDGESQAGPALLAALRHADAIEPLRKARQVLRGDACSVIRDRGDEAGSVAAASGLMRQPHSDASARLAVLDGVLHQVLEHL